MATRPYQSGRTGTGRSTWLLIGFSVFVGVPACKHEGAPRSTAVATLAAAVSASASAAAATEAPPTAVRCRAASAPGAEFSLGRQPAPVASGEPDDDGVALPFAPEIGTATTFDGGFAAGALELSGKATTAFVVVLSPAWPAGKKIDLGAVHGDVSPPAVVADAQGLVVAVPDGAPNGTLLRLARIADPRGAAAVTWGAQISEPHDDSDAFALELGPETGVVAWDEWDAHAERGVIRAVTFPPRDLSKTSVPVVLSGDHEDAEAPSIALRPGGFWVAWIVNAKRAPTPEERQDSKDTAEPLDLGPRYVVVVPLDPSGKQSGAPLAVTPKAGHASSFDLATAADGSALVAVRDDPTSSPGASGGALGLALVRAGGSVEPLAVTDDDIGVGTPSLLADTAGVGDVHGWLSVTSESDAIQLAALDGSGHLLDALAGDDVVRAAAPIAAHAGQLLVARPRGRGVTLEVLSCESVPQRSPDPVPSAAIPE